MKTLWGIKAQGVFCDLTNLTNRRKKVEKIIREESRKGNSNETLVLFIYEGDGFVGVDLDVITAVERVKMASTKHKSIKGAEQFFTETLKLMEDIYGYNK